MTCRYVFFYFFRNHGDQENPYRVHEKVQGSKMGDFLQVLRGLPEVPPDAAGDGALPQTLVLGRLGQRLGLQRLVHPEDEQQQDRPSVPPTANILGDKSEVVRFRTRPAS